MILVGTNLLVYARNVYPSTACIGAGVVGWAFDRSSESGPALPQRMDTAACGGPLRDFRTAAGGRSGHGLAVCSTDGDFARFPEVKWINPLRTPMP